ncbi:hypothetical protein [Roseateles sp.]|uniref:hypothetical protein n=1 Tax=Roseateles sp. TaxID=1971397 RepID=UPI0039EB0B6F
MRALLLWLLVLALPVYGASSTSLRVLGPAHWHAAPAPLAQAEWLQPALQLVQRVAEHVQALRAQAHVRAHALGARHEHHGLQRHWHDAADGSVHSVGSAHPGLADLVASAAVGGAALTLGAPVLPLPIPVTAANGRWPAGPTLDWLDVDHRPTPPPPRH